MSGEETRVEREHRWFEYGRWFPGFGSSMDPHRCGDPGTTCQWRERTVTFGPWSNWHTAPSTEANS